MRLIEIYSAIWRLRLARYCFRAGNFFAALGAAPRLLIAYPAGVYFGPPVHAGGPFCRIRSIWL